MSESILPITDWTLTATIPVATHMSPETVEFVTLPGSFPQVSAMRPNLNHSSKTIKLLLRVQLTEFNNNTFVCLDTFVWMICFSFRFVSLKWNILTILVLIWFEITIPYQLGIFERPILTERFKKLLKLFTSLFIFIKEVTKIFGLWIFTKRHNKIKVCL